MENLKYIRANTRQYSKYVHPGSKDKYYSMIFINAKNGEMRDSRMKFRTVSDVLAYAHKFNQRRYLEMARPYSDHMGAGDGKFKLTRSSLYHTFINRGTKIEVSQGAISPVDETLLVDISVWQGDVNFETMKASPKNIQGCYIKASQADYADPRFTQNSLKASNADMPKGFYHFYDSRKDPLVQANKFWNLIKSSPGHLYPVIDFEENYGGTYKGWQNLKKFLIEFMRISNLSADQIIIYTGYYYWISNSPSNAIDLAWFGQFKLWLAWYTSNPSYVIIPKPWTQATLYFWQFGTPVWGIELGVESLEIDGDKWLHGIVSYRQVFKINDTSPPPEPIGYGYNKVRRFGSDVYAVKLKSFKRALVTNTGGQLKTLSEVVKQYGSQYGINADGWFAGQSTPISLAASEGNLYQPNQYQGRPFINIDKNKGISISTNKELVDVYNLASGTRFSVYNGLNFIRSTGSVDPVHITDMHPRTAVGHTSNGELIMCVVDGRSVESRGVTLLELGDIMVEAGAQWAIEFDGGGSSSMDVSPNFWTRLWSFVSRPSKVPVFASEEQDLIVNVPSDGTERPVANHLLIFTESETSMNGQAKEILGKTTSVRDKPSRYGNTQYTLPANSLVDFLAVVNVAISGNADKEGEQWLKLVDGNYVNYKLKDINGILRDYYQITKMPGSDPEPPAESSPITKIELDLATGSTVTIQYEDGTSKTETT